PIFLWSPRRPCSTLFPYTTLFRSRCDGRLLLSDLDSLAFHAGANARRIPSLATAKEDPSGDRRSLLQCRRPGPFLEHSRTPGKRTLPFFTGAETLCATQAGPHTRVGSDSEIGAYRLLGGCAT